MKKLVKSHSKITSKYQTVVSFGYCQIQSLLRYQEPIAYKSSAYGWDCDYYEINENILICTGYRPCKSDVEVEYHLVKSFEDRAQKNNRENWLDDNCHIETNMLLLELIKELTRKPTIKDLFVATYNLTAFNGVGIIDFDYDIEDSVISAFFTSDEQGNIIVERKRKNKLFTDNECRVYFNKYKQRYYIDEFMRTNI